MFLIFKGLRACVLEEPESLEMKTIENVVEVWISFPNGEFTGKV